MGAVKFDALYCFALCLVNLFNDAEFVDHMHFVVIKHFCQFFRISVSCLYS